MNVSRYVKTGSSIRNKNQVGVKPNYNLFQVRSTRCKSPGTLNIHGKSYKKVVAESVSSISIGNHNKIDENH